MTAAVSATSRQQQSRLPEIQGLRALAVLLVVCFHSGLPLSGGFVGVDVFFVISGYVITRLLLRDLHAGRRLKLGRFYRRRVRRLLPAAALTISVTVLLAMVIQSPVGAQTDTAIAGLGSAVWLANAALYVVTQGYFAHRANEVPLEHMWSLAVEEQFYLVFPALLAVVYLATRRSGRRTGRRTAIAVISVAAVLSFASSVWLGYGDTQLPAPEGIAYFAPFSRAWEFAAGALVALVPMTGRLRGLAAAAWVGIVAVVAAALVISPDDVFPGYIALLPVLGTTLLLAAVAGDAVPGPLARVLSSPAALWLGDRSYSWYLWHWPLIVFVGVWRPDDVLLAVLAGALSLPIAHLAYVWVEDPIRRRTERSAWQSLRLVAVCIAIPVTLSLALYAGAQATWGSKDTQVFADQVRPKSLLSDDCLTRIPLEDRSRSACTVNADAPGETMLLVGDSNAAAYADGLAKVAESLGRPLVVATVQGCSFIDVQVHSREGNWDDCHDLYRSTVDWLERQAPALVVLASANEWTDYPDVTFTDPTTGAVATSRADRGQAWERALLRTYDAIRAAGHDVVQVSAVPHFLTADLRPWGPEACSFVTAIRNPAGCGTTITRADADRQQAHGLEAETAAAIAAGVPVIPVRDAICAAECSTNVGNRWIYRDGAHISVRESRALAPVLEAGIRAAD